MKKEELLKNISGLEYYSLDQFEQDARAYIAAIKQHRMLCRIHSVSASGMSRTISFHSCEIGKNGQRKMKNLTTTQKRQIARLAVEKSETIENGTMHVYSNGSGFEIFVNSEYRDDEHEHVASLNVWNENKPYTQAAFIRQLENI